MRTTQIIAIVAGSGFVAATAAQTPGTAFTYQGRLESSGAAASGPHDLRFSLWVDPTETDPGIARLGLPICRDGVLVSDGLFTVELDFGAGAIVGFPVWLEIEVRTDATPGNCGGGSYATLSPRQPLRPAPYAVFASTAGTAGLKLPYTGTASIGNGALLTLENNKTTGTSHTGIFWNRSAGDNSRAFSGISQADSGLTYGVYGQSNSTSGVGVHGESFGLAGIRGVANHTTIVNYGGWFETASEFGVGVYGYAPASSGVARAVMGVSSSPDGYAGYFSGARNYFSGRVGFGTLSPTCRIDAVETTTSLEILHVKNQGSGRAAVFESLSSGATSAVLCYKAGGPALHVLGTFSTAGSVATDAPLAVAGGSDTAPGGGGFVVCGSTGGPNISIDNNEIMARSNGAVATLTLNNDGGNVHLIPNGTGSVGIGTTAPQKKLDVNGSARINGGLYFGGGVPPGDGFTYFLSFATPGISEDYMGYYDNTFAFQDSAGGGDTEHPALIARDYISTSDERLKKDFAPLTGSLEKVRRLQGLSYRFDGAKVDPAAENVRENPRVQIGFSAQAVAEVVPEVVHYSEPLDQYGISYASLVPVLVEAIKEQQGLIDAQHARLDEQRAIIDALRADLDEIKARLSR